MANSRKSSRSREEIESWRRELQQPGVTLKMIAEREGTSKQNISQLVGPLGRHRPVGKTAEDQSKKVVDLFLAGRTDEQIAEELGMGLSVASNYRQQAGYHLPNPQKKWTPSSIIKFAQDWYEKYGLLSSGDWNPSLAKASGQEERARLFYESGAPHTGLVQHYFGSWSEMKRQAGIPESPEGRAVSGRFSGHAYRLAKDRSRSS